MLLAVALALLVAQVLAGIVIVRADRDRAESRLIEALAFQLVAREAPPRRAAGDGVRRPVRERRELRTRGRLLRTVQDPELQSRWRDEAREVRLRELLESRDIVVGELIVLTGAARMRADRGLAPPPPVEENSEEAPMRPVVLAGLQRAGTEEWTTARAPLPAQRSGPLQAMIFQSAVLYLVLVGGLAFLLRRITRPLASLTTRVENFSGNGTPPQPMEPVGPADTRRLISAHNAMEQRIAALLDEKDVMLGAIGHDLKTPLAALRVRIESVEDEDERGKMAATIEDITNSLDDMLSLARVGRPSDPLERTDLAALVTNVVEEYEDRGRNVAITKAERIAMPLRATWLRRAIRNLVSNAVRYGDGAKVELSRDGDDALIRITDQGPGIPDDQIASMLEPFKRGDASRNRATGGAGLGLTLARAIAEQHGGTLTLSNAMNSDGLVEGLVAELRLPTLR